MTQTTKNFIKLVKMSSRHKPERLESIIKGLTGKDRDKALWAYRLELDKIDDRIIDELTEANN